MTAETASWAGGSSRLPAIHTDEGLENRINDILLAWRMAFPIEFEDFIDYMARWRAQVNVTQNQGIVKGSRDGGKTLHWTTPLIVPDKLDSLFQRYLDPDYLRDKKIRNKLRTMFKIGTLNKAI